MRASAGRCPECGSAPCSKLTPVRRRLFSFFSALSLLLCVAVCVLWVQSYRNPVKWLRVTARPASSLYVQDSVWNTHGVLMPGHLRRTLNADAMEHVRPELPSDWSPGRVGPLPARNVPERLLGYRVRWVTLPPTPDSAPGPAFSVHLGVPHWLLATISLLLPAQWVRSAIRRRRGQRNGLCPQCGYDLRATPARCPECGTAKATA
jgi:hypothetical protein